MNDNKRFRSTWIEQVHTLTEDGDDNWTEQHRKKDESENHDVSKCVWEQNNLACNIAIATSPFEAFKIIDTNYGECETQDAIELLLKLENLQFKPSYDKSRFVSDFEHLMEDFSRLGLVYPDPLRRILFLYKLIKNNEEQASPLGVFYSQMSATPVENRTFNFTKDQFFNFDMGKLSQK